MKKEIHLHLDEEVANQIDEMCNHVYEGNCFDNIRLNEFVQNLQYILVYIFSSVNVNIKMFKKWKIKNISV